MFKKVKVVNGKVTESSFVEGFNKNDLQVVIGQMGALRDDTVSTKTKKGADWKNYKLPDGEYLLGFCHFGVMKKVEFFTGCRLYSMPTSA